MSRDLPGPAMNGGELADGRALMSFRDMTPETEIQIATRDGVLGLSVRDVQRWIHPTAPPNECMKFLLTCRLAGVNPFVGEAHLVSYGDRWGTIIDKSGYLRRAQAHPAYDGHQAGIVVRPWDATSRKFTGPPIEIEGTIVPADHLLIGGWARVHRRDRRVATYASVSMQEYGKQQGTWKQIPCTMIRKTALVQALRESGLITPGWNDPAEMPCEPGPVPMSAMREADIPPALDVAYVAVQDASCPPDVLSGIHAAREALGIPEDSETWRAALAKRGVASLAELSPTEGWNLLSNLRSLLPGPIDDAAEPAPAMPEAVPEVA